MTRIARYNAEVLEETVVEQVVVVVEEMEEMVAIKQAALESIEAMEEMKMEALLDDGTYFNLIYIYFFYFDN